MDILCHRCSQKVPVSVIVCKCGSLFFCSQHCYEKTMKTHKKECPAYLRSKQIFMTPTTSQPTQALLHGPHPIVPEVHPLQVNEVPQLAPTVTDHDAEHNSQSEIIQQSQASVTQNVHNHGGRDRDMFGRFLTNPGQTEGVKKVKTADQVERDQVSSKVTKWKQKAVEVMEKIQKETPEVSQCYTFEPNKYRGSSKTILYISKGGRPKQANNQSEAAGQQQPSLDAGSNQSVSALGSVSAQIADFAGPSTAGSSSSRQRLSMCSCYICKEKLGADNSKRLVCTKRDCFRAPAHLDCLNFDFPSSMLPKIRCYYKCPYHRGKEQAFSESESDELNMEEDTPTLPTLQTPNRVRQRNDSILRPMRLSSRLMEVLGTPQKYLKANEVKTLVAAYAKKLLVQNKMYVPDQALSSVLGTLPFKMISVFKLLKLNNHLSMS